MFFFFLRTYKPNTVLENLTYIHNFFPDLPTRLHRIALAFTNAVKRASLPRVDGVKTKTKKEKKPSNTRFEGETAEQRELRDALGLPHEIPTVVCSRHGPRPAERRTAGANTNGSRGESRGGRG